MMVSDHICALNAPFPILLLFCPFLKARIKKIMQKDEEVGKVAQATPIVICASLRRFSSSSLTKLSPAKALELFLQLVVDEASRVTTSRGSKKVEAYHLCVLFLIPIYSAYYNSTPFLVQETCNRNYRNARLS